MLTIFFLTAVFALLVIEEVKNREKLWRSTQRLPRRVGCCTSGSRVEPEDCTQEGKGCLNYIFFVWTLFLRCNIGQEAWQVTIRKETNKRQLVSRAGKG